MAFGYRIDQRKAAKFIDAQMSLARFATYTGLFMFFAAWSAEFFAWAYLQQTPKASEGQVFPLPIHATVFYVTQTFKLGTQIGFEGGWILGFIGLVSQGAISARAKRRGWESL